MKEFTNKKCPLMQGLVLSIGGNVLHKTSKGMRKMNYQDTQQFERGTKPKLSTKTFIGFMRCYRQFFPVIKFVDEIPFLEVKDMLFASICEAA